MAALLLIAAGCDDASSPVGPGEVPAGLTMTVQTAGLTFHYAPGDQIDADWQQQYHEWATARLGVSPPRRIQYFKYRTQAQLAAVVGRNANGWADLDQLHVHSIWPRDDHETVHLYVNLLGHPVFVFNEGIAVAFQVDPVGGRDWPMWAGQHVHLIAQSHRRAGTLPSLAALLGGDDFWDFDDGMSYPVSGSFVFFLIEQHGIEPIIEFCRRSPDWDEPESTTRARFEAVFGTSLDQAERAWHDMLDGFSG